MTTTRSEYNVYQQLTSCRVATTANLSASYSNGPINDGVGATLTALVAAALVIDGVTLNNGDRVLVNNQTNGGENGIYVVINSGSPSISWILQRSNDFQSIEQLKAGLFCPVSGGTTFAGSIFSLTEPLPAIFGVSALTFSSISTTIGTAGSKAASNPLLPTVASVVTPTSIANTAVFNDGNGTIGDAGFFFRIDRANFGGGSNTFVIFDSSIDVTSVAVADIESSVNPVTIQKVTPAAGILTILMSGDPGVSTFSYISASQPF